MVHKQYCDICGNEIVYPGRCAQGGTVHITKSEQYYDLCIHCIKAVERAIKELKERHRAVLDYKNDPHVKGQKELGEFE